MSWTHIYLSTSTRAALLQFSWRLSARLFVHFEMIRTAYRETCARRSRSFRRVQLQLKVGIQSFNEKCVAD